MAAGYTRLLGAVHGSLTAVSVMVLHCECDDGAHGAVSKSSELMQVKCLQLPDLIAICPDQGCGCSAAWV